VVTNTRVSNTGDAAILLGLERGLRHDAEEVELSVHDDDPPTAARRLGREVHPQLQAVLASSPLRRRLARLALRAPAPARRRLLGEAARSLAERYAHADVVISTGGTYLSDWYDPAPRLRELRLAQALGRPVVLYTQSIGPIRRRSTRRGLRRLTRSSALIMVREEDSRAELARLGDASRTITRADAAYALADADTLERARRPRKDREGLRVAISVRSWPHFEKADPERGMRLYMGAIAALTDHLVRYRGARVTFVSTCQGDPAYGHDDSVIAYLLTARLPLSTLGSVEVDGLARDPAALMGLLGSFDIVVATRLHAGILALAAGTPALFVAYERKAYGVAARLGIAEGVQPMEGISAWSLIAAVDSMLDREEELRPRLFACVEHERREALEAGRLVREALRTAAR